MSSLLERPRPATERRTAAPTPAGAFGWPQVAAALPGAVRKLDPRTLWRNPVILLVWAGAALTTAVAVAVLFALALALLVATRPVGNEVVVEPARVKARVLTDLADGVRFMVKTPWLLWTLLFASVFVLVVIGPLEVLLPFIATERFEDGARSYGLVLAAFGMGGALGALGVSSRRLPQRYLTVMLLMWGAGSLPLIVIGWTSSFWLMVAASFLVGVTDGAGTVIWGTLLQRRVPPEMLGRVSSLDFFVSLAFMPVSMAIAGPLSKVVSMQTIFAVAGILPIILALIALAAARMPRDEIAHPHDSLASRLLDRLARGERERASLGVGAAVHRVVDPQAVVDHRHLRAIEQEADLAARG